MIKIIKTGIKLGVISYTAIALGTISILVDKVVEHRK